jgi:hypothetical protein
MTSNPVARIERPARLLVNENEQGGVWAVYNAAALPLR